MSDALTGVGKDCNLIVNQSYFNCQPGILGILAIFVEQLIPFGLQLVSICILWFLHGRAILPILLVRGPTTQVGPATSPTVRSKSVTGPRGTVDPKTAYFDAKIASVQN